MNASTRPTIAKCFFITEYLLESISPQGKFSRVMKQKILGLELALVARAAPDAAILVRGHPEAVVHPALVAVEDEAPAQ